MNIIETVNSGKIVIFDGAMGTQLELRGAPSGGSGNVVAPDTVVEIQKEYIASGSTAIIANTFCLCRIYMDTHHLDLNLEQTNRAGVEIAKKASGGRVFVLGDVGPTGQMLKPLGDYTEDQFLETFIEQATVLAAAGIDAFIIETMMDLKEAVLAVKACKKNFSIPVIASMTFASTAAGGRTMMGDKAADCAVQLRDAGADILGTNCGSLSPEEMAVIVESYRSAAALPVLAQPNAGKPRLDGDKTIYDMNPESFAAGARKCLEAGASLIGGCCGTSPAHIKALAAMAAAFKS